MKPQIKKIGNILLTASGFAFAILVIASVINYDEGGIYYGLAYGSYILFPAIIGLGFRLYAAGSSEDSDDN